MLCKIHGLWNTLPSTRFKHARTLGALVVNNLRIPPKLPLPEIPYRPVATSVECGRWSLRNYVNLADERGRFPGDDHAGGMASERTRWTRKTFFNPSGLLSLDDGIIRWRLISCGGRALGERLKKPKKLSPWARSRRSLASLILPISPTTCPPSSLANSLARSMRRKSPVDWGEGLSCNKIPTCETCLPIRSVLFLHFSKCTASQNGRAEALVARPHDPHQTPA